jgi:hypothetical protein
VLTLVVAGHEDRLVHDKIQCDIHGEMERAYLCVHLGGDSWGRGFNSGEPSEVHPYPDAWCDDCEIIRAEHEGWNDESEALTEINLVCSGCYELARIRNLQLTVTLADLAELRWKCSSCDEWHRGPCLDFGFSSPHYWDQIAHPGERWDCLSAAGARKASGTFLDTDYCAIEGRDFFVRGILHLPILGTAESFRWGVWGSVSRENFERLLEVDGDPERVDLPAMFSWLSSRIQEYPDTLSLKMQVQVQEPGIRPIFRLDRCDHPLAIEFHEGISPERVREIMLRRLPAAEA